MGKLERQRAHAQLEPVCAKNTRREAAGEAQTQLDIDMHSGMRPARGRTKLWQLTPSDCPVSTVLALCIAAIRYPWQLVASTTGQ
jgi:hypothetical protein